MLRQKQKKSSLNVVLKIVDGASENEEHLLVEARNVIPHHEDDSSKFACDRDGILGVQFLLFVGLTGGNQVPVDKARFN